MNRVYVQTYTFITQPVRNEIDEFSIGLKFSTVGDPLVYDTDIPWETVTVLQGFNVGCTWDLETGRGTQFTVINGGVTLHGDIYMGLESDHG